MFTVLIIDEDFSYWQILGTSSSRKESSLGHRNVACIIRVAVCRGIVEEKAHDEGAREDNENPSPGKEAIKEASNRAMVVGQLFGGDVADGSHRRWSDEVRGRGQRQSCAAGRSGPTMGAAKARDGFRGMKRGLEEGSEAALGKLREEGPAQASAGKAREGLHGRGNE